MDKKLIDRLNALGHGRPTTRREFLAAGLQAGGAMMVLPSAIERLLGVRAANATSQCDLLNTNSLCGATVAYLQFEAIGGMQRIVEPTVTEMNGSKHYLSAATYAHFQGEPTAPTFNTQFGAPIKSNHGVLQGILEYANNASFPNAGKILTNTRVAGLAATVSPDDHPEVIYSSPLNIVSQILCANFISTTLGDQQTFLGGRHMGPIINPGNRSLYVTNIDAIRNQFGFGPAIDELSKAQQSAILEAIKKLNDAELRRLASVGGLSTLTGNFNCAVDARVRYLQEFTENLADPRQVATLSSIYGINSSTASSDQRATNALAVYSVLKRYAATAVITLEGFDYHYSNRAGADAQDLWLGRSIGKALATAAWLNVPVMIGVITDGCVSASHGSNQWNADFYKHGMQTLFYFNPTTVPTYVRGSEMGAYQAGNFTELNSCGVIDETTFLGNPNEGAVRCAWTIILNLLKVNYPTTYEAKFRELVTSDMFPSAEITKNLVFG